MCSCWVVVLMLFFVPFSHAETVGSQNPPRIGVVPDVKIARPSKFIGPLDEMFVPAKAQCTEGPAAAKNNENDRWREMSLVHKGDYIWDVSAELARLHGYDYSPRTMTCKIFMESTFRPLIKAETSTSCGLSQVTEETGWEDVIEQAGYQTKIPGAKPITSLAEYQKRIASSMVFQIEIAMMTLERKRVDFVKQGGDAFNIRPILEYYRGADDATNKDYAERIIRCANCMNVNFNMVSEECLNCTAKENQAKCEKYRYAP